MKPKQKKYAENEEKRFNWLQQRREAFRNGQEARNAGSLCASTSRAWEWFMTRN